MLSFIKLASTNLLNFFNTFNIYAYFISIKVGATL